MLKKIREQVGDAMHSDGDFLSTIGVQIFLTGTAFITGLLTARWLGPEGRGVFAIVVLWPSVLASFGNLGIREALVYFQAEGEQASNILAGAAFAIALFQSVLLMAVGWFLIPVLTGGKGGEIIRLSQQYLAFLPANLFSLYPLGLLRGQLRIREYNLLRAGLSLCYLAGLVYLGIRHLVTVWNVAQVLLIANYLLVLVAWYLLIKQSGFQLALGLDIYRKLFSFGVRTHLGSITTLLNTRFDQMVMAVILTPVELGWYAVAVSVSSLTGLVSMAWELLALPRLARLTDPPEQQRLLAKISRQNLTATGLLSVGLIGIIPFAVPLVYGQDFRSSIGPAVVLIIAGIFLSMGRVWKAGLSGLNKPLEGSKAEVLGLAVTGLGLWALLTPLRIYGAALASLAAYLASALFLLYTFWRMDIPIRELIRFSSFRNILNRTKLQEKSK